MPNRAADARTRTPQRPTTASSPQRALSASPAIPDAHALFAAFVAPRLLIPLTGREVVAAYLRIVDLDSTPLIASRLGLSYAAAAMVLWRCKLKLGAEEGEYGWFELISSYAFEAGKAAR